MWQDFSRPLLNFRKPWIWILILLILWGLILGVLSPWLIKHTLQKTAKERLQAELHIERLRINPYSLSVTVGELQLSSKEKPVIGFSRLYINFQLSSLFRWAWSFDETHLLGVQANIERYSDGTSNLQKLAQAWQTTAKQSPREAQNAEKESTVLPRIYINDLQLSVKEVALRDAVPHTPFDSSLGPISLKVAKLSTLLNKSGQQQLTMATEDGAKINWQGEISLNPFGSEGQISLEGPFLQLPVEYLQDQLNFDIESGSLSARMNYAIAENNSKLQLKVTDIHSFIRNLLLVEKGSRSKLFKLPELEISDGQLQWPQQQASVETINFKNAELWLKRDKNRVVNLSKLINKNEQREASNGKTEKPQKTGTPWQVNNANFQLSDWNIYISDESLPAPANFSFDNIQLAIKNLSSHENTPISISTSADIASGSLALDGQLVAIPFGQMQLNSQLNNIDLTPLQAYISPYARVELKESLFNADTSITAVDEKQIQINSAIKVKNFKLADAISQQPLLEWELLSISDIQAELDKNSLDIGNITLDKAYVDFAIAENGSTTVDRVLIPKEKSSQALTKQQQTSTEVKPFSLNLASISITNAAGKFSDVSLSLPFATEFRDLNGGITSLSSNSREPADVKLEGKVDEYGLMRIKGALTPFEPKQNTDIDVIFKNLDIPKLNPYTLKFAGRSIEQGKLNVDLGYRIRQGQLQGSNNVELQKLKLGKKIDQEEDMDIPLDMAVALLKDGNGNIDINLPVKGDLNDPAFNYGKVVQLAFSKLIKNIVSSPFRLLGSLVSGNDKQLSDIYFDPGSSAVTPPEREKLTTLVSALQQRPKLRLEIRGVYVQSLDEKALKAKKFTALELEHSAEDELKSLSRVSKPYIAFAEARFLDLNGKEALRAFREELTFRVAEGKPELDKLAYSNRLREYLIDKEELLPQEMTALADERAQNVQRFLKNDLELEQNRVSVLPGQASKEVEDELVKLELKLESI